MKTERFLARCDALVAQGNAVLATRRDPGPNIIGDDRVESEKFYEWKAAGLSFLQQVFGDGHPYFRLFEDKVKYSGWSDSLQGQGVLKAANEELRQGLLGSMQDLVAGDVFADFLEMADHLLEMSYKDAAASITGAVLENGLRRIAAKEGRNTKGDLSALNQSLADGQIYNRLQQKRVQVWNDIRNSAAHGRFGEYEAPDVMEMILGVRSLLAEHL